MALIIRLRQQGKTNRRVFRLVVTDKRNPRDGKYIENLGWYNPFLADDKSLSLQSERIDYWLKMGAEISERAKALVLKTAPEVIKNFEQKKVEKKMKKRNSRKEKKEKK